MKAVTQTSQPFQLRLHVKQLADNDCILTSIEK